MLSSLLNRIRRTKSASGYQRAELTRLVFLRPYIADAMFNNARSAYLLRDTRLASLYQNARLTKSASLKCHQANVTISNARSASPLSRGETPISKPKHESHVYSTERELRVSEPYARSCDARLTFALRWLGSEGS